MIFKKVDFLSPPVTLYNHGVLSHSSAMSGILYIISLLIIFGFGLYYFLKLIKREEPEAFFYNHFIEDAGEFTLNSSSLFHYISLYNVKDPDSFKGFDFESFRLVGIDTYLSYYEADKNLSNFDHWLYGFCNNESDTKGISHLTTHDFLTSSACILKNILILLSKNIMILTILILDGLKWLMELIILIRNFMSSLWRNVKMKL